MRIRDHPATAAALLLACTAALPVLLGPGRGESGQMAAVTPARPLLPSPGTRARKNLEWCRENVEIIHDVYWASACVAVAEEQRAAGLADADDSPDCTLPNERARPLNAARAKAEERCMEEAIGSMGRPGAR